MIKHIHIGDLYVLGKLAKYCFVIGVSQFVHIGELSSKNEILLPGKQKCVHTNSETFLLRKQCLLVWPHKKHGETLAENTMFPQQCFPVSPTADNIYLNIHCQPSSRPIRTICAQQKHRIRIQNSTFYANALRWRDSSDYYNYKFARNDKFCWFR